MQTTVLPCTGGCGRTKTVNLPDGVTYNGGSYLCAFDDPRFKTPEQIAIDAKAADDAAFDARVLAAMQRVKATDPEVSILVDDDANPVTPPILKRIWNFIFK